MLGACERTLKPDPFREGLSGKLPRSKPESGNPTIRACRGGRENVTLSVMTVCARLGSIPTGLKCPGLLGNRSTLCRAVDRVARRGEATWHALRDAARRSMVNGIDETGWNVDAQLRWLWVAVSEVTFCDILPGRGFSQAASILGADYDGWLTHDGWRTY